MPVLLDNFAHIYFHGFAPSGKTPAANPCPKQSVKRAGRKDLPADEAPMDPLMAWMLERAGLCATDYRANAMKRRLTACLRHLRAPSVPAAREMLERQPELLASVLNTALIGVTGFFRDEEVFACLASRVLPELARERTQINVCSVGVSGGQELYSTAMLLAEAGILDRARCLGVDCRSTAIRNAEVGIFPESELAGVSPERRARFFLPSPRGGEVAPVLKERIQWKKADVMNLTLESLQSLILFRNVGIYFNEPQAASAWTRLCGWLEPGGLIVTGKAEKPPSELPLERIAPSIYRRIYY